LRLQGGIAGCIHSPDNATVPDMRLETMSALEGAASPVRFGGGALEASDRISEKAKNFGGDMSYQFRSFPQKGAI